METLGTRAEGFCSDMLCLLGAIQLWLVGLLHVVHVAEQLAFCA